MKLPLRVAIILHIAFILYSIGLRSAEEVKEIEGDEGKHHEDHWDEYECTQEEYQELLNLSGGRKEAKLSEGDIEGSGEHENTNPAREGKGRILPGVEKATADQFPFFTSLIVTQNDGSTLRCAGAIISDAWVLTAASCVASAANIKVYGGWTSHDHRSERAYLNVHPGWSLSSVPTMPLPTVRAAKSAPLKGSHLVHPEGITGEDELGRHGIEYGPYGPHGPYGNYGPNGPYGNYGPNGPYGNYGPYGHYGPYKPNGPYGPYEHYGPNGPYGHYRPNGPYSNYHGEPFVVTFSTDTIQGTTTETYTRRETETSTKTKTIRKTVTQTDTEFRTRTIYDTDTNYIYVTDTREIPETKTDTITTTRTETSTRTRTNYVPVIRNITKTLTETLYVAQYGTSTLTKIQNYYVTDTTTTTNTNTQYKTRTCFKTKTQFTPVATVTRTNTQEVIDEHVKTLTLKVPTTVTKVVAVTSTHGHGHHHHPDHQHHETITVTRTIKVPSAYATETPHLPHKPHKPRSIHSLFSSGIAILHPEYSRSSFSNNIALVRLQNPSTFSGKVLPVRLQKKDQKKHSEVDGISLTSMGFARDNSSQLYFTKLEQISRSNCESRVAAIDLKYPNNTACLSSTSSDEGFCHGGIGGPVVHTFQDDPSATLLGIISQHEPCPSAYPLAYTKIEPYLDWIKSYVKPLYYKE